MSDFEVGGDYGDGVSDSRDDSVGDGKRNSDNNGKGEGDGDSKRLKYGNAHGNAMDSCTQ